MILSLVLTLACALDAETEDALKVFARDYASAAPAARAAAVTQLAKLQNTTVRTRLANLVVTDEEVVRIAAAEGLGAFTLDKGNVSALLTGALPSNLKLFGAEAAILRALGKLGDESALGSIHSYFEFKDPKDPEFAVAKAAISASALLKSPDSMEPLMELAKHLDKAQKGGSGKSSGKPGSLGLAGAGASDPQVLRAKALLPGIVKALQAITGEKWTTLVEWTIWWDRHKSTFKMQK
ncbi:MAG TPA: hypothetical protein VKU80_15385 [Planctomycetota bacterium]|nr:hypothetical protein [Planctomycetota bacterium]